ncbi:hypothetical protein [Dankookia sp. P2]|uniref:hypothetical protein n=1 Tax=Dankookia sp. P2 TaxID=3423955 RepID=UPI003D66F68C
MDRLIGTMMGALRMLPGTTDNSVAIRNEDLEDRAAMTLVRRQVLWDSWGRI